MSKIANTPAFPIQKAQYTDAYGGHPGMTLRQHYAGLALQGLVASNGELGYRIAAEQSVQHADALIAELEKEKADG